MPNVHHPSHYNAGRIEVIDFLEDQNLGFHLGNVVKYICRSAHKGRELEDLLKAEWYLNRFIESRKPGSPVSDSIPAPTAAITFGHIQFENADLSAVIAESQKVGPIEPMTVSRLLYQVLGYLSDDQAKFRDLAKAINAITGAAQ
jgi:hypothetical protein